nr:ribonuclease H-like domain-containing protein [Tanacetum cinerariifolium]
RGKIDQTLFIKRQKEDILLVQVYVDDIIFGSTKTELCTEFEELMHPKFQISSIGELTFFLGLQVKQKPDRIFISQDKYVDEILRKFNDYAGASIDRKSTLGGCQFLGCGLISWQCKKQTVVATSTMESEYVAAASCFGQVLWIQNQLLDYGKRGLGYVSYNAVPPPHTERFSPLRIDLSHTGLPEFAEPSVHSYRVKPIKVVTQTSSVKISKPVKQNNGVPLIEDRESEEEDEVESPPEIKRKTVEPSEDKVEVDIPKQNDKPPRTSQIC